MPSLPGYVAVPVRYNSWNKMLMEAVVNGHRARLVVDTGAGYSVLEAAAPVPSVFRRLEPIRPSANSQI